MTSGRRNAPLRSCAVPHHCPRPVRLDVLSRARYLRGLTPDQLAEVDRLPLEGYHPWHVTRAELLRRLGRSAEARAAYDEALARIDNEAERRYLTRRRGQLA